jgi:hypothetical protein
MTVEANKTGMTIGVNKKKGAKAPFFHEVMFD